MFVVFLISAGSMCAQKLINDPVRSWGFLVAQEKRKKKKLRRQ
jgi:hypothetical protein